MFNDFHWYIVTPWLFHYCSPPDRVIIARSVCNSMLSFTTRTVPSPMSTLTAPLWKLNSSSLAPELLPAVLSVPGGVSYGVVSRSGRDLLFGCPLTPNAE